MSKPAQNRDTQDEALLELVEVGDLTLAEAVSAASAIGARITIGETAKRLPSAFGDHPADAVKLAGLSPSHKLCKTPAAAADLIQSLLESGKLYPPWREFPWWPEPAEPM